MVPGEPPHQFNGTVEQVVAEAIEINPHFLEDFEFDKPINASDSEDQFHVEIDQEGNGKRELPTLLSRRWAASSDFSVKCNGRWVQCNLAAIRDGYRYLWGLKGKPTNGPGPGNCGRVSCSYDSAIWWCNDVSHRHPNNPGL